MTWSRSQRTFVLCAPHLCACRCWLRCFTRAMGFGSDRNCRGLAHHVHLRGEKMCCLEIFDFCPNRFDCYCNSGNPSEQQPFDLHYGKLMRQESSGTTSSTQSETAMPPLEKRIAFGSEYLNWFSYSTRRTGFKCLLAHLSAQPVEPLDSHYSSYSTN